MNNKKYNENDYIAFNSYGGFNSTKDEYHILNTNTPLPWCNIMANEKFGTIISSYGTVYTYYKNSREFKLSDWCNDWVTFKPGEKFKGIFENDYNLIYGFGYTSVLEETDNVSKRMDIFIPTKDNIKLQYITLENKDLKNEKNVDIEYIIEPVLGVAKETNENYVLSRIYDNILEMKNPYSIEFSNITCFIKFLSYNENIKYSYDEKNYSVKASITIQPNTKINFAIAIGATENEDEIAKLVEKYSTKEAVENELKSTKQYWRKLVVKNIDTGNEYLNIMANGWLLYQTIVCRLFARSGFYQSGGAIGFRDQLQDSMALISSWPEKTRSQIILHASKQFEKGDVLHWWHEHNNARNKNIF